MTNRSVLKFLLPVLVITLAIGVFLSLKASKPERENPELKEKVWQVDILPVLVQSLRPSLTLYGRVESPELLQSAAPGPGIVSEVLVQNGSRVVSGQLLVKMDQRDFQFELVQAESELRDIENQVGELQIRHRSNQAALETEHELLQLAQEELQRMQKLQKQNLGSESALNEARSNLGRQRLSVISRELEVESFPVQMGILEAIRDRHRSKLLDSNLMIERSEVIAPFDGVIYSMAVSIGDHVATGQIMVSLYPIKTLEIRAHIPSSYVTQVQQALSRGETQQARLVTSPGNRLLTLKRLAGEAAPSGIDAYFGAGEASRSLSPGALLTLSFTLPRQDDVIAIPYQAIYGNSRLYLLSEGRLQGIDVETVGQFRDETGGSFMLVRSDQINQGDSIVVTHLPNAITGLKVMRSGDAAQE